MEWNWIDLSLFIFRKQYSGTNAEITKADTVIFRTDLYNDTTKRLEYKFKRTLKYDSKWLDSKYNYIHNNNNSNNNQNCTWKV